MEEFARLFGSLLAFVYHCFDRIVILGHLPLLTRPENIVHFFRNVHGIGAITKDVLRQRTIEYNQWVEAFASNHNIPIEWAEKGRTQGRLRPPPLAADGAARALRCLLHPQEYGGGHQLPHGNAEVSDYRSRLPHPQPPALALHPLLLLHPRPGAGTDCVGSFLPFSITYYLNGYHFIEQQLRSAGIEFRKTITRFCGWRTPKHSKRPPTPSAPS